MPAVYIMVGVPASGKDWYIEHHKEDDDVVISSDDVREELGDVNDQTRNKEVFSIFYDRMNKALAEGHNVWINATNVTAKNRVRPIQYGRHYNAKIVAIVMLTPIEQCIANEELRDRKVGEEVIRKFNGKYEMPSYSEGFSEIKVIMNGEEVPYEN